MIHPGIVDPRINHVILPEASRPWALINCQLKWYEVIGQVPKKLFATSMHLLPRLRSIFYSVIIARHLSRNTPTSRWFLEDIDHFFVSISVKRGRIVSSRCIQLQPLKTAYAP